jgi:hypothetical protein
MHSNRWSLNNLLAVLEHVLAQGSLAGTEQNREQFLTTMVCVGLNECDRTDGAADRSKDAAPCAKRTVLVLARFCSSKQVLLAVHTANVPHPQLLTESRSQGL